MASEVVCGLVFRLLLPICLAVACAFRYNGLSFVYLIYLLLIPLFSEPTKATMQVLNAATVAEVLTGLNASAPGTDTIRKLTGETKSKAKKKILSR